MSVDSSENPKVSVIMATFNEPGNIVRQSINSILEQTFADFELLIFDDSTDPNTIKSIDECAVDKRVIVVRKPYRIGFVKALNMGLKMAKGKYIARMDGDDISKVNRLELQVSFLEQNPKYAVIGGAINIMNKEGIITSYRYYPSSSSKLKFWSIFRSPFAHPTVMMKRDIVDKGFLYNEEFQKAEDLELWMRLMKNGFKFYNMKTILLDFRINENFENKRSGNQLRNNYKARYINFTWTAPFRCILSLIVGSIYIITPLSFVKKFYRLENTKTKS